jgi:PEP-CTERM motif
MRASKYLVSLALASLFMLGNASATNVTFGLTDFMISSTTTTNVNLTPDPLSAPALPADATFTLPADAIWAQPPNPSNTYLAANEGKFFRFTFDLPSGFHDLAFAFEALVNDEFALYVNNTVVAIQGSTGTDNFAAPLPGFSMNAAGIATDTSGKLEYLLTSGMQPLFHTGTNELVLFGTDTLLYGGVTVINGTITAVPEPDAYGLMVAGLGLVGWMARRRKQEPGESRIKRA